MILPVFGSSMPSAPCDCAVYQTVPSGAGATSCGCAPCGTSKVLTCAAGAWPNPRDQRNYRDDDRNHIALPQ